MATKQKSLFKDSKPETPPAQTPGWVLKELVETHGLSRRQAESFHPKQAFAVMFAARRKVGRLSPQQVTEIKADLSGRIVKKLTTDDWHQNELYDLIAGSMSLLDGDKLALLCGRMVELLAAPSVA